MYNQLWSDLVTVSRAGIVYHGLFIYAGLIIGWCINFRVFSFFTASLVYVDRTGVSGWRRA